MKRSWMYLGAACVLCVALARAGEAPPFKPSADEAKLLELTNQERKKMELPPLRPSALLFQLARAHSANMAKQEKMAHNLDDKTPFDRLRDGGYVFQTAGENVAAIPDAAPVSLAMQAWMESEGHRANILNADYAEIGLGVARGKDGKVYLTQVFGTPRPKE